MKMLIASDLHGSAYYCKKLLERLEAEGNPTLFLLGDILYHGPRNDLPEDYAPKKVIELLDPLKDNILCVRGNCDGEIDQKVLGFSILSEYALINDSGLKIYAAHGHRCGESDPPPMAKGACCSAATPMSRPLTGMRVLSMSIPVPSRYPRREAPTDISSMRTGRFATRTLTEI